MCGSQYSQIAGCECMHLRMSFLESDQAGTKHLFNFLFLTQSLGHALKPFIWFEVIHIFVGPHVRMSLEVCHVILIVVVRVVSLMLSIALKCAWKGLLQSKKLDESLVCLIWESILGVCGSNKLFGAAARSLQLMSTPWASHNCQWLLVLMNLTGACRQSLATDRRLMGLL